VQKYAGEIDNFKSWLSTLTHNLCVDIHRERSRGANRVEDIEIYASSVEQGLVSFEDTQDCAMETGEKRIVIRRAIDNLPTRMRETFILHFYHELSYPEIAQQQEISYQNVCKRISQARAILREELREYFIEEDGTDTDKSVPPAATESAIGEMSEGNAGAVIELTTTSEMIGKEVQPPPEFKWESREEEIKSLCQEYDYLVNAHDLPVSQYKFNDMKGTKKLKISSVYLKENNSWKRYSIEGYKNLFNEI
jgi:RNA polymerase sigma factor (sigma-70 family)